MIYLDHAATSLYKPPEVIKAVASAMETLGNPGRGYNAPALQAGTCVYNGRKALGEFFKIAPSQVVFTASATESLNIAISGLIKPGQHVITTVLEHNSVLRPLYKSGAKLSFVGLTPQGQLDYTAFEKLRTPDTTAVAITHGANLTGLVVDLPIVADFCHRHGLLLIVDAAQTAGLLPIDITALGIHALCFTGHKSLLGPQGIGGLCLNGVAIAPGKVGGTGTHSFEKHHPTHMPDCLEAGTLNTPGIAGLTAGIAYVNKTGTKAAFDLANAFYTKVAQIPQVKLYSTIGNLPVVALNIGDMDSTTVEYILAENYGIAVRGGTHCAPLLHEALGTATQGIVRFSFSTFNTTAHVTAAVKAIGEIAHDH